jgi:hypothetical protein
MPQSVHIRYDKCRLTLYLPNFFENAGLEQIHKIMKMLRTRPDQNAAAYETLEWFFPSWEADLKDRRAHAVLSPEVKRAKTDLERYRKVLAAYRGARAQKILTK